MAVTEYQKNEVKSLLAKGNRIQAIYYLRTNFNLNLIEAKMLAEQIEKEMDPSEFVKAEMPKQLLSAKPNSGKFIFLFFAGVGAILLSIGIYIFINQSSQIEKSILVEGVVVSNPAQPTIQYEYQGQTYTYYSSVSSNPPSYVIGERVEIYIDTENPNNAIVNTITDRWFAILLLSIMGGIFLFVGLLVFRFV